MGKTTAPLRTADICMRNASAAFTTVLLPLLASALPAAPAQAQTFEETALYLATNGDFRRMQDAAQGIVAREGSIEIRASFDRDRCAVTTDMITQRSAMTLDGTLRMTIIFGNVNPASIVRSYFDQPPQTMYEPRRQGVKFTMESGNGQPICESSMTGDYAQHANPSRALRCDTTAEILVRHEVAPRFETALKYLFDNFCTGVRSAF